ncbi:helix-turn-helix domain-containing protein [Microbacterium sp. NPDC019599]|uniref:TetR/AcrR family transcriptional regulator n=1 Tax=Microbacterium sp. NPDC019599 TaxID=3154690 RepID=UPI00340CBB78
MRADAEANREKLLDAAAGLFAEQGVEAPFALIAERAGVGKGTLYRHFADRDAVIVGLGERARARFAEIGEEAASVASAWDAILVYIDGVVAMYVDMPWLVAIRPRARQLVPLDESAEEAMSAIIDRAWAEGSLRDDVDLDDLQYVPALLSGLVDLPEPRRATVLARLRAIVLDGLRPENAPRMPLRERASGQSTA